MSLENPAQDRVTVHEPPAVSRLDVFLRQQFPCVSRSTLRRLIDAGAIRVNDATVKPTHQPRVGEVITIDWPPPVPAEVLPNAIPLDVLYEDADLIVIDKPPGLVVHPACGHDDRTLVNALLHHCAGQLSGVGGVERPGIVHRLDQFTSGVMVSAKNDPTHMALSFQFAHRQVEKVYHAIACGHVTPLSGDIHAAIARHCSHRKLMAVREGGRSAHTAYRTLERLRETTLIEARLHTGRTHQVRVHFQHLGFPLLGDTIYGRKATRLVEALTGATVPRHMLHAFRLGFVHPRTLEPRRFEAPWPEDFAAAVRALRSA